MKRALLAVLLLVAAGCGASPVTASPDTKVRPPAGTYATSVTALAQKAESIAADSCTTKPAAQVYLSCARYVAEAGNLALAAQSTGVASAPKVADAVKRFSTTGCVAAPGVTGPPASTCGAALADVQAGVKSLKKELTALSAKPT
jgi:hypothetical protein